jgi:hypothetical protein
VPSERKDEGKETKGREPAIAPGMSHEDIATAGGMIDLPYEAPPGDAQPLQYADDLPDEKGWTPPEGFKIAGVDFADAVAGIGGGAQIPPPAPVEEEENGSTE